MEKLELANLISTVNRFMSEASAVLCEYKTPFPLKTEYDGNEMKTRIIVDLSTDRTNFKIWTPSYSESFRAGLIESIPKSFRQWDRDEKCWRVEGSWLGNAQLLIDKCYPGHQVEYSSRAAQETEKIALEQSQKDERQASKRRNRKRSRRTTAYMDDEPFCKTGQSPYDILGVLPNAPDDVIKAAYKALMKTHHPDKGGSEGKVKELSAAYEDISKERKWKG